MPDIGSKGFFNNLRVGYPMAQVPSRMEARRNDSRLPRVEFRTYRIEAAYAALKRIVALAGSHYNEYRYLLNAMPTLKLTKIGTSTGAVIPKEMLHRMKVDKGDTLFAVETPEGYLLTPYDPAVEEQLGAGREFMKQYRETFKALAK